MPLPRFRMRTLLIAVAVAAVGSAALWADRGLTARAGAYRLAATRYGQYAKAYRDAGRGEGFGFYSCYGSGMTYEEIERAIGDISANLRRKDYLAARAAYYERLAKYHDRAARYPGLLVAPELPPE